jgi:hypothetical protein
MFFLAAEEMVARLVPMERLVCAIVAKSRMIGKETPTLYHNTIGLAITDPELKYAQPLPATDDYQDLERVVWEHKTGGVMFGLPMLASFIEQKSPDTPPGVRMPEDITIHLYLRKNLMNFFDKEFKNPDIMVCTEDNQPIFERIVEMKKKDPESWNDDLKELIEQREMELKRWKEDDIFPNINLSLDAAVSLNIFLREYCPGGIKF